MEERTRGYKELFAWQRAMELVPQVYRATKNFPKDEMFGITSQLRRAIVSVPANIAEGQGRIHPKEFVNFLSIARGSLAEVDTLLSVSNRLGYLDQQNLQKLENQTIHIRQLLQKLIRSIGNSSPVARRPTPDVAMDQC